MLKDRNGIVKILKSIEAAFSGLGRMGLSAPFCWTISGT
jgi:hypothetical protein